MSCRALSAVAPVDPAGRLVSGRLRSSFRDPFYQHFCAFDSLAALGPDVSVRFSLLSILPQVVRFTFDAGSRARSAARPAARRRAPRAAAKKFANVKRTTVDASRRAE